VTIAALKDHERRRGMALLRQGRLSVSPVTAVEFAAVVELGA